MPAHHQARRRTPGVALLIVAGLLWGTGGFSGTLLAHLTGLSPIAVAAYRLAVAGLLLGLVLISTGRRLPLTRAALVRVGAVGALTAIYQTSYFVAVALTSVGLATLVTIGSSPVLVIVIEALAGRRALDRTAVGTVGLALVGLALLVGRPAGGSAVVAGAGPAVLAGAGFAVLTVIGARPVERLDEVTTAGIGFGLGGVLLLAVAAPTVGIGFTPGLASIGLVGFLGLVPTALAYACYFRGLPGAGPGTAAVLALLEPLVGTLLSVLLLHERLTAAGLLGAVLLMLALVAAARR